MFGGTVNFILSVSPAFRTTDVVVTMQLLATLDGAKAVDVLQDSVTVRMGSNNRRRFAFATVGTENLVVTAAMIAHQHRHGEGRSQLLGASEQRFGGIVRPDPARPAASSER